MSPRTYLILLFVAAFAIRLAAVASLRDVHAPPDGLASADDVQFHRLAARLAEGEGYVNDQGRPTSFRAPGWPLVLAAVYWLFGVQPVVVYVLLCALGAASCLLTYALARELAGENSARWAGLLAAIYLGHIYFAFSFVSESLFVPCLALGGWLFIRFLKFGSIRTLALAGLVLGWATLTRPFGLLLLPMFLLLLAWFDLRQRRLRVVPGLVLAATFAAVILPWTLRNYLVHGELVLIATNGGSTFYGGNNSRVVSEPRHFGAWISTTDLPHRDLIDATPNEVAHDKMEWKLGLDWLREHPAQASLLVVFKALRMWWLPEFDAGLWQYLLRIVAYAPFFVIIMLGLWRCVRERALRSGPWLVVHATLLATVVTCLIFWGCARFRDANVPFLMLYAVLGVEYLVHRRRIAATEAQGESGGTAAQYAASVRLSPSAKVTVGS